MDISKIEYKGSETVNFYTGTLSLSLSLSRKWKEEG